MTRDDIIAIAQKCGYWSGQTVEMNDVGLEHFASLVAAAEREACAKVCFREAAFIPDPIDRERIYHCAAAIRARSST